MDVEYLYFLGKEAVHFNVILSIVILSFGNILFNVLFEQKGNRKYAYNIFRFYSRLKSTLLIFYIYFLEGKVLAEFG